VSETKVILETREWDTFIAKVSGKLKDTGKLLSTVASLFAFKDIMDHFQQEEGPDSKWQRRSPSTQEAYSKIAAGIWKPPKGMRAGSFSPTNKLLQLTGNLRQSINPGTMKQSSDSVTIFANAPYSAVHQEGGGGIPARPFMWLSDDAQDKMLDAMMTLIAEGA